MNTVPTRAFRRDAEGFEHPSWCDLGECTAPSMLRIRGIDRASVPLYLLDNHLSTPWTIDATRAGDTAYTVQVWRGTYEVVSDTVEGIDLVADATLHSLRVGLPVTVAQLDPLIRALTGARDTAIPPADGDQDGDDIAGGETR